MASLLSGQQQHGLGLLQLPQETAGCIAEKLERADRWSAVVPRRRRASSPPLQTPANCRPPVRCAQSVPCGHLPHAAGSGYRLVPLRCVHV